MSLVGCRISCLIDNKEWHEGFVTSLSSYGKHLVEFHLIGEQRWLNMKRIAFFIAERPPNRSSQEQALMTADSGEYKEDNIILRNADGLAPIEDMKDWVYVEDISLDYAFAQSVLFKVFGGGVQETGHKTRGHTCLTDGDKFNAKFSKGSLLYGELLPRGANKAFGVNHLDCSSARVLFDLGMGTGKVAIQAFLQFRNLEYVYGVELSEGRYQVAEEAVLRMANLLGADSFHIQRSPGNFIILMEKGEGHADDKCRVLHLERGNLFDTLNMELADVVMLETDIPSSTYPQLCHFLNQMHVGARTLSYLDLRYIWCFVPFNFQQLERNKHLSDRYPTSWSVQRGHHFFIWNKMSMAQLGPAPSTVPGDGSHASRKRSQKGGDEGVEAAPAKSHGCLPTLSLFSSLLGRNRRVNRTVIPRPDSPEAAAAPEPPQPAEPRAGVTGVSGISSLQSSRGRSPRGTPRSPRSPSSSSPVSQRGSPRDGGAPGAVSAASLTPSPKAKRDSPRRSRAPAPAQKMVYTPRASGAPKMSDFAFPAGAVSQTGAEMGSLPCYKMDVDAAASTTTTSPAEEKEQISAENAVVQQSPMPFPQVALANPCTEGVASSTKGTEAVGTEQAAAFDMSATNTPPHVTAAAVYKLQVSVETTESSLVDPAAPGLETEIPLVHVPLALQFPLLAGQRSPYAADSDTMNTPMRLKHPGENTVLLEGRRADLRNRQMEFLSSLPQEHEEVIGKTELSFVERQWDRSLIEPVARPEKVKSIDPRANPDLSGLSSRKASAWAKGSASGVGRSVPEAGSQAPPAKPRLSKKQRNVSDESSCTIS